MDLYYAAEMDGCSDIQIIIRIVLPLSKPIVAVMVLFYALNHWNAYFHALLYLNREQLFPLQLILREIFMMNEIDPNMLETAFSDAELQQRQDIKDLLKYAIIIVANAPMLMAYPLVQRYFVKGVMIGAIKG
jgi:ABC-type glycerol-3-phosphate transport system permease component